MRLASEVSRSPVAPWNSAVQPSWRGVKGYSHGSGCSLVSCCSQLSGQGSTSKAVSEDQSPSPSVQSAPQLPGGAFDSSDTQTWGTPSESTVAQVVPQPGDIFSSRSSSSSSSKRGWLKPAVVGESIRDAATFSEVQSLLDARHVMLSHFHVELLWLKLAELSEIDPEEWLAKSLTEGDAMPAWLPRNFVQTGGLDSFEGDWEVYDDVEDEYSDDGDDEDFGENTLWTREQLMHLREQRLRARSSYSASSSSSNPHPHSFSRPQGKPPPLYTLTSHTGPLGVPANAAQLALGSLCRQVGGLTLRLAPRMEPRAISVSLSCMANLRYSNPRLMAALIQASEQQLCSRSHHPHGVASMVWAFATLKYTPPMPWLHAAVHATVECMEMLSKRQVAGMVYCFGVLKYTPSAEWMRAACSQLPGQELQRLRPFDLTLLITGLATMHQLMKTADQKQSASPSAKLPDGGKTGQGLTSMYQSPVQANGLDTAPGSEAILPGVPSTWLQAYVTASAAKLVFYDAKNLCQTLTAMSTFKSQPSEVWMNSFYEAGTSFFTDARSEFTTGHASTVVKGLARMNCRPDIAWLNEVLSKSRATLKTASSADLTALISGLAALRFRAGEGWLRSFLSASFRKLPYFSTLQCCATLSALARLGQRPPPLYLSEMAQRTEGQMSELSGRQLVELLCALVRLGHRPNKSWLAGFEKYTHSKMSGAGAISAEGLADMAMAMAQLKYKPQISWLYSLVLAAYRRLDSFDAPQLSLLFRALPMISQPGWLDELVQICAAETSGSLRSYSSSLDEDDGWDFRSASVKAAAIATVPSSDSLSSSPKKSISGSSSSSSSSSCDSVVNDPEGSLPSRSASATSFASAAARAAREVSVESEDETASSEAGSPTRYGFFRSRSPPTPSRRTFLWSGVYLNEGSYDEADSPTSSSDGDTSMAGSNAEGSIEEGQDQYSEERSGALDTYSIPGYGLGGNGGLALNGSSSVLIPWDVADAKLDAQSSSGVTGSGDTTAPATRYGASGSNRQQVGGNGPSEEYPVGSIAGGLNSSRSGVRPAIYRPAYSMNGSGRSRSRSSNDENTGDGDAAGPEAPPAASFLSASYGNGMITDAGMGVGLDVGEQEQEVQQAMEFVRSSPGLNQRSAF